MAKEKLKILFIETKKVLSAYLLEHTLQVPKSAKVVDCWFLDINTDEFHLEAGCIGLGKSETKVARITKGRSVSLKSIQSGLTAFANVGGFQAALPRLEDTDQENVYLLRKSEWIEYPIQKQTISAIEKIIDSNIPIFQPSRNKTFNSKWELVAKHDVFRAYVFSMVER